MRLPDLRGLAVSLLVAAATAAAQPAVRHSPKTLGVRIADLTWVEAERVLDTGTVVVIPVGAEAKEHGPQLRLKNDWLLAEYYARRVLSSAKVVLYPTVNYSFYPAFVEYPGSTTVRLETARDMIIDICRVIARHGPKRFYILNTGVSTVRALKPAQDSLAASGLVMRFSDLGVVGKSAEDRVKQEEGGTHADEIETSMMLYMYPQFVDMKKVAKDYHPGAGGLTRDSLVAVREGKTYSKTGIFGDATLATRAKGRAVVEQTVTDMLAEIAALRRLPIPKP